MLATRCRELQHAGVRVEIQPCDVTDEAQCQQAIANTLAAHGRIDILVYAAGLTQVSLFRETELSVYRQVMEVNFFGAVAITQAALPSLCERRGRLVVLSSIAGFAPLLGRTGYCASKHALQGFFDTLRCELIDQGVSVTMVCPSFVDTDFARRGLAGDGSVLKVDRGTTGAIVSPETVAEAVYRGALARKRQIVISPTGKLAYWLSRLVPGYYQRGMTRRFQADFKEPDSNQS
jgi:short-subunit dehydrogenase